MTGLRAGAAGPQSYDFAAFGLSEMVRAAASLRVAAEQAPDFAAAAAAIVEQLQTGFVDAHGTPVLQLVRLFSTRRFGALTKELQHVVLSRLEDVAAEPDMRCLTLEATTGVEPAWKDPAQSQCHRVIPLPSAEAVAAAPMISALVADLGLPTAAVVAGGVSAEHGRFDVFHVPVASGSQRIPDQEFVTTYGISSVLGFGGALPDGDVFCVVMFSRVPIPVDTAQQFRAVAVSVRVGLLAHPRPGQRQADLSAQCDALREHLMVLEETSRSQAAALEDAVDRLRTEVDLVDTLQVVGQRLTAQLDLDALVQDATDAATKATGAAFGAFFYNMISQYGKSYLLYTLSGAPKEAFAGFPMPRDTPLFSTTFTGNGTVRCADVTRDPRYGNNLPHRGMPAGHLPVRSYLAVPVISPSSREVLGGFFFGHCEPGRFTARQQHLAEGIAGYAAIALDNARLFDEQRTASLTLQRAILGPTVLPAGFAVRYEPAISRLAVGGDWYDIVELSADLVGVAVGDCVGHGLAAAAVMGQLRTACRALLLEDHPPAQVLTAMDRVAVLIPDACCTTLFCATIDRARGAIRYSCAGHPPAILARADGRTELLDAARSVPLATADVVRPESTVFLAPGDTVLLYTDGLVERRHRSLDAGIRRARDALAKIRHLAPAAIAERLAEQLLGDDHDDDIAYLLYQRPLKTD